MTTKINSDTSDGLKITSDTSGILDIQSAGTTKMTVGSTIDIQGNELVLDADADTSIHADTDDRMDFKAGGSDTMHIKGTKVGIGNNNPDAILQVTKNTSSGATDDIITWNHDASSWGVKIQQQHVAGSHLQWNIVDFASNNLLCFERGTVGIGVTTTQGHLHVDSEDTGSTFGRCALAVTTGDPTVDSSNQLIVCAFTGDSDCTNGTFISFRDSGGEIGHITCNGTSSVQYSTSSDYRLKENVDYTFDATTRLKQLKPCRFNFKADTDKTVDGFLAHEVSSIVPEAISGTKDETKEAKNVVKKADGTMIHENVTEAEWTQGKTDGTYEDDTTWSAEATVPQYQGIDQSKLVPLLVKTIQELEARITALES